MVEELIKHLEFVEDWEYKRYPFHSTLTNNRKNHTIELNSYPEIAYDLVIKDKRTNEVIFTYTYGEDSIIDTRLVHLFNILESKYKTKEGVIDELIEFLR